MKTLLLKRFFLLTLLCCFAACGGYTGTNSGSSSSNTSNSSNTTSATCTLTENTTESATINNGCNLLTRDTSACQSSRLSAGLSAYWLNFSCRVTLSKVTKSGVDYVQAVADSQPDYKSNYFETTDPCYEAFSGGDQNPNLIEIQNLTMLFPLSPNTSSQSMPGGVVGLALNGVAIFDNEAAPGDDIFEEAETFDKCQAHPNQNGQYHYHSEPYSLSYDDSNFIGVMRDGYPIYGRKDADGSTPTLDSAGGHTGSTPDSPSSAVYHYHVNAQTSSNTNTAGQTQFFITTGTYKGSPGTCTGC